MRNRIIHLLFLILTPLTLNAQKIKGRIISEEGEIISYAHVYLAQAEKGTYSNEFGDFELSIPDYPSSDTLVVSHVSYMPLKLSVANLVHVENLKIELKKKNDILGLVKVYPLNATDIFQKIKSNVKNLLQKNDFFSFYEVRRCHKDNELVYAVIEKLEVSFSENNISIGRDSLIQNTILDIQQSNNLASVNISAGDRESMINTLLFKKILFEDEIFNEQLVLSLSSDTTHSSSDTLWINEENKRVGYLAFDNERFLPEEVFLDFAKSEKLQKKMFMLKLYFRLSAKRSLKEISQISLTQRYKITELGITPEFCKLESRFISKKSRSKERLKYEKIYFPASVKVKGNKLIKNKASTY